VRSPPGFNITSYEGLNHLPASILVIGAGFSCVGEFETEMKPPQTTPKGKNGPRQLRDHLREEPIILGRVNPWQPLVRGITSEV